MSEIERAIEYYKENEFYFQKYNADLVTMKMNELALTALKEKLEREKNPLTCDGCKREEAKKEYMHVICMQCTRMNQTRDGGGKVKDDFETCSGCYREGESRDNYPCNICTRNADLYGDKYREQEDTDEG